MKGKIESSKPDIAAHSPLKPKAFPNLAMLQTSRTSSSTKLASPLQGEGSRTSNMEPNLFQYNDRAPLLFSSDEDQPSFNYFASLEQTKKQSILEAAKEAEMRRAQNSQARPKEREPAQEVEKSQGLEQEVVSEERAGEKMEEVIINKIYVNKSLGLVGQSHKAKETEIEPSKQTKPLQELEPQQEISSVYSKTDEIIEQVNFSLQENILIDQSSRKSSDHHPPPPPPEATRLSQQSATHTHRKRRNRIFDNSSKNRNNKSFRVTPEKGIQTEPFPKESREFDYSPQRVALNILDKLVDQINPNQKQQLNDVLWPFTKELEHRVQLLRNIKSIEEIGEGHQQQIAETIQRLREMKKRYPQINQTNSSQMPSLSNFHQLAQQLESIQKVVSNSIQTKLRLSRLLQSSKGLLIMLRKKELKRIYTILQEVGEQVQRLKAMKAACGKHQLEKMFKIYLEVEINQLEDMHKSININFKSGFGQQRS